MSATLSTPVATNVTILGEVTPGGTVRGSYFYSGAQPEGDSIYRWYRDGENFLISLILDYLITPEMAGSKLRFSVTPISSEGEAGIETFSPEMPISDGYQNITEEENRNSFMSQRGHHKHHTPDPKDKMCIASNGALSLISGETQSVHVRGRAGSAGEPPQEIRQYLKNNPATQMFSTELDFGALVPVLGSTKRLLLWGVNMANIPPQLDLNNIRSVYGNRTAVAFIYDNPAPGKNTIGAFGNAVNGGVVPTEIQTKLLFDPPKAIYATENAFAVLTNRGSVYAWGSPTGGGQISLAAENYLRNLKVERIIASASAFCAIGPETINDPDIKHVVPWGDPNGGGSISAQDITYILDQDGVDQVVANRNAFCAITKLRKRAISWGSATHGGTMSESAKRLAAGGNILLCRGSTWAFCMVNNSGVSESWGAAGYGGGSRADGTEEENDAGKVFENSGEKQRIEALFKEMKVNDWYEQRLVKKPYTCTCSSDTVPGSNLSEVITPNGVINFYSNDASFFMVAKETDGRTKDLFSWGQATGGGVIPPNIRQVLMASQITAVFCTNGAYGVISTQGSITGAVFVFGGGIDQQDAGIIPVELEEYLRSNVKGLYAIMGMPPAHPGYAKPPSAFAARCVNGEYVIWGGGTWVINELFKPTTTLEF